MAKPEHFQMLRFYWSKITPDQQLGARWAQLIGARRRLQFVCDELRESSTEPEIEKALDRLAYNAQNYLIRAYELRERVVSLIAMLSTNESNRKAKQFAGELKKAETRTSAIAHVRKTLPKVATPLRRLLAALDKDIELRNVHTHDMFLCIGMWTGDDRFDPYDPYDALLDLEYQPKTRKDLEALLRKGIKRLARKYQQKADCIIKLVTVLVELTDPHATVAERRAAGI